MKYFLVSADYPEASGYSHAKHSCWINVGLNSFKEFFKVVIFCKNQNQSI